MSFVCASLLGNLKMPAGFGLMLLGFIVIMIAQKKNGK